MPDDLIGSKEAADLLDKPLRTVIRMVERGDLVPVRKLPGLRGSFVFRRSDVLAAKAAS